MSILSSVPGVRFYVRGLDLGTAGSSITTWADQSGLGNDVTKVAAGTAPTVAGASTPSGAKSARWGASSERLEAATTPFPLAAMASSTFSGYSAAAAFDGNAGTYWASSGANPATTPQWVRINWWSAGRTLTSYGITPRATGEAPSTFKFQGSNDGNTWTDLDTRSGISWPSTAKQTFTFSNSTAYKCYRLYVTAAVSAGILVIDVDLGAGNTPDAALTEGEFWAVIKVDSGQHEMFANTCAISGDAYYPYADGNIYWTFLNPNRPGFTPTLAPTSWRIVRLSHGSGVSRFFIDGVQQQTQTVTPDFPPTFWIGQGNRAQYFSNANIAAFLVLDHVATSGEITTITNEWTADYLSTGPATVSASAGLTAPSTLAVAAVPERPAAASMSAPSALAVSATRAAPAAATMSAPSTMAVDSTGAVPATAALQAPSTLSTAAIVVFLPSAALTAMSTLSVALAIDHVATAALAAPSTLTAAGATFTPAAAALTTPSSLAVSTGTHAAAVALAAPSVLVATATTATDMTGWTADLTGQAVIDIDAEPGLAWVDPDPVIPPATITERPVIRVSHIWPAPNPAGRDGRPLFVDPPAAVRDTLGVPHVWVGGQDVTYFRGSRTLIGEYGEAAPYGDDSATITFPQIHAWENFGTGDLAWAKPAAPVEIGIVRGAGHPILWQFAGRLYAKDNRLAIGGEGSTTTLTVEGSLLQGQRQRHHVKIILPPTDLGTLVADELNGVISRGYGLIPRVATGIPLRHRGAISDTRADYVNALLALGWTEDGRQWGIAKTFIPRHHRLALRANAASTPLWTITAGARGITHSLTEWDLGDGNNVIYGRGIGPDGRAWAGWCFPNLALYEMPPYPYASAGAVMTIGSTDAGTTTGQGVSLWQSRMVELGLRVAIDGVFGSQDRAQTFVLQRRAGILEDGIVGPQTWATTFDGGLSGADLSQAYRRPLAWDPRVEPKLYAANGAVLSNNPVYDRRLDRSEDDIDFGNRITRDEARPHAQRILARNLTPGITGEIVLDRWVSPHEGSSFEIHNGDPVRYLGYGNGNPTLVVSGIRKDPQTGRVRLAVDSKARDAMTWAAIRKRDQDAQPDPARTRGRNTKRTGLELDVVVPFDGDSPAGKIGAKGGAGMPLYAGLWTCRWVYVGEAGQTAWIKGETYGPATKFAMLLFSGMVTSNQCASKIGNPLASTKPWLGVQKWLDANGFIDGWGLQGQAAGYWPGSESDGDPVTGELDMRSPVTFEALEHGGWIRVALWSPVSTFVRMEFRPAVVQ